ncbi:MAG: glycosyltransferase [Betaproteobacteria bacterium]|nr:glycosyltransferase [Betaproteobacteria bacterium]
MTTEASLMPVAKGALPDAKRVLVLAPHADDEVFGCGGALALHVAAGAEIKAIVLSDGAFGAAEADLQAAVREAESRAAAAVLGYPPPEFWRLPDRGIEYGEVLVGRLLEAARAHAADLVYAPSLYEVHPDHRVLAMAAVEAVRRLGQGVRLAMYEVGAPLRPNLLLDISPVFERKRDAMRCFVSQLARQRYDEHIAALNRYRTYTLPKEAIAAEAFELRTADDIEHNLLSVFASEGERQRQCGVVVNGRHDVPLVSVIIRSMDRPTLREALDSVALQTYPNIEVVLVNAKGPGHTDVGEVCGRFPLRMVGKAEPLRRSRAANMGLENAHGEYLGFLDDDDWFAPEHIASLVAALIRNPDKKVAYDCVACADETKRLTEKRYCQPFDRIRLLAGNFIPIHALLFSRSIVDAGCRFDEAFDLYEDWDFWLRAAEFGDFVFVDRVGAYYRLGAQSGQGVRPDMAHALEVTASLLEKWRPRWRRDDLQQVMAAIRESEAKLQAVTSERDAVATHRDALAADGQVIAAQRDALAASREELLASTSWRITRPVRFVGHQSKRVRHLVQTVRRAIAANGGLLGTFGKLYRVFRKEGWPGLKWRLRVRAGGTVADRLSGTDYQDWVARYDSITDVDRVRIRSAIGRMKLKPCISVLLPTYNPKPEWLEEAIQSVRQQLYPNWELCIADDASTEPHIRSILQRHAEEDSRIKLVFRERNGHISAATNSALALATGDYVALLDHDDALAEHALFCVVEAINRNPEAGLIYSDEDKLNEQGRRFAPYFKCDWNYDLFLSHNLVTHLAVYRTALVRELGGCREGYEGAQDYDLALRVVERLRWPQIVHIPRVLYHWRVHEASTSVSYRAKPYAVLAGKKAINDHLVRVGSNARVESLPDGQYRVRYALPEPAPRVSLIIPTRNSLALIRQCVSSILEKTDYPNYDILIVDNGSADPAVLAYFETLKGDGRIRVLRDDRPFNFSALNNLAVSQAEGKLVGLINNDIEVITPDWLTEMVSIALQPGVGAVGARLWYPNDTLQHGGVVLVGGVAGHSHKGLPKGSPGYARRAELLQSFSAVTAACLVIRKTIYQEVGGLDEGNLKVAFNDVDFCLKVRELGYRNVWSPYAELYHHESATRGYEDTPDKQQRFAQETGYMRARWGDLLLNDPAYSPNLTLDREDFSYAWPPRVEPIN